MTTQSEPESRDSMRPESARPDITRPDITRAVRRGAVRALRQLRFSAAHELTFPSGRRADIVALKPDNDIWIIEVKSGVADYRADLKWADYEDYCDGLVFAVAEDFPLALIPPHVGVIIADGFGGELMRPPERRPLAAARRKAVTLAFARAAAERLMTLDDPDFAG
jgi:hypothetical protein